MCVEDIACNISVVFFETQCSYCVDDGVNVISVNERCRSKHHQQRDKLSTDDKKTTAADTTTTATTTTAATTTTTTTTTTAAAAAAADDDDDDDDDRLNSAVQDDAVNDVDDDEEKIPDWIRCSPANLYFKRDSVVMIISYELITVSAESTDAGLY